MIRRFTLLAMSLMLLFAATAEATTGHCAKRMADAQPVMSAHCAERMGMEMPETPTETPDQSDATVCCCAISVTPVLFDQPMPDAPLAIRASWSAPTSINGPPGTDYIDLPPPRS